MEEHVQVCAVSYVSADIFCDVVNSAIIWTIFVVIEIYDNYHSCYSDIIVNCKVSWSHVTVCVTWY